ncbi:MAG: FtsW/RodA/SpoVE family cell cycle protein [Bacilli bacterium]
MLKTSKYKVDIWLLVILFLFIVISILTIGSAQNLIATNTLVIKQILWYIAGFAVAYFIMFIGNDFIYRNAWILYILGIISLICLLIFATPINNAKCWFSIPGLGTIQPSEFMKIILIITLGTMIHKFNDEYSNPTVREEFYFLIKVGIIVLIPSVLTFLQPDTGVVLIYLLITVTMLFISGIRYRWFIIALTFFIALLLGIVILYFVNTDLFIKIFGTDFFLRIDRLLDWSSGSGYQLENGLTSIGSGGFLGMGLNKTPIYFPEPQTDFIFAVYANNFGFLGAILLILLLLLFDIKLIILAIKNTNLTNKLIIAGIVGMLIYQQFQNIGMTLGIMPITGITLPFISYGGSSLISYMIMIGIIFNISNETLRYTN